jgi:hypothetical protein
MVGAAAAQSSRKASGRWQGWWLVVITQVGSGIPRVVTPEQMTFVL